MTFEDLQKANSTIKTTPIKGKEYAEVNQRIKVFRMLYPEGSILTELVSNDGETCVFKASILADGVVIGTGTAFEEKKASFINKTSYIENCETSAVGRALAMCGIGIDVSIASKEEVENAINNQNQESTSKKDILQQIGIEMQRTGITDVQIAERYKVAIKDMSMDELNKVLACLKKTKDKA